MAGHEKTQRSFVCTGKQGLVSSARFLPALEKSSERDDTSRWQESVSKL